MTLSRRLCTLLAVDEHGRPQRKYEKGGLETDFLEAAAAFCAQDGADEVWLRLDKMGPRGAAPLYDPLETLEKRVFVPLVAWAPLPSPADARLLLSFGADRVVVDAWAGLPDPLAHIARVVQAVGKDRVGVAVSVRRVVGHKGVAWELVDGNLQGTGLDALQLARRLPEVGAAEIVLSPTLAGPGSDRVVHDGELIESVLGWSGVPVLSHGDDADAADMAAALLMGADGVVSALPSTGKPTGLELKEKLAAYGLAFIPPER